MTDPYDDSDDEAVETLAASPPLQAAHVYLDNATSIGGPGQPDMTAGAELQARHADMARTAALVSIAESLHQIAGAAPATQRRIAKAVSSLDTMAKEWTKLRYLARRG